MSQDTVAVRRGVRLAAYAVEQVRSRRARFGHLSPREYLQMMEATREREDAETLRLIEAGHFDVQVER
jgi:hypothetical protein